MVGLYIYPEQCVNIDLVISIENIHGPVCCHQALIPLDFPDRALTFRGEKERGRNGYCVF